MLAVLHKVVLGLAPPQLAAFFPFLGVVSEPSGRQRVRGWAPLHCRQFGTPCTFTSTDTMQRSLFGLVRCYDKSPQSIVDAISVNIFQRALQEGLKVHASSALALDFWPRLFSTGWRYLSRRDFQAFFG